jgi:hypothetical protein
MERERMNRVVSAVCGGAVVLTALCLTAGTAVAEVTVETVSCMGLPNCLRLSNGTVEVVMTTDIGPRIIGYRRLGGPNMLAEMPGKPGAAEWQPWGGHRLWLAPEAIPWSYAPDNAPIDHRVVDGGTIVLDRGVEKETGIAKVMEVTLAAEGSRVTIVHRLTNRNDSPVEVAPWALTIVRGGGSTIIPNEPYVSHDTRVQPIRPMAMWAYTDLSDPRWTLGPKFIRLATDATRKAPQKIGIGNRQGWGAYAEGGEVFLKRIAAFDDAQRYPDYGTTYQTYTAGDFMELETLGALVTLAPGAAAEHTETWWLFGGVDVSGNDDAVERTLKPLLDQAR